MMLVETTQIPEAALPLADYRAHLRLGSSLTEDGLQTGLLTGFLRAALAAVEGRTGKALIERDFLWTLRVWPERGPIVLPIAPVSEILEIRIVDAGGTAATVSGQAWQFVPDMTAPEIRPRGAGLPPLPEGGAAQIDLRAGFGPAWTDLPFDLRQAVLMLAAHYYEYRNETAFDGGCMPFGVSALIERYRGIRLFRGGR